MSLLLLADYVLRRRGFRHKVPITVVTPEPYAGHLGIGEMGWEWVGSNATAAKY